MKMRQYWKAPESAQHNSVWSKEPKTDNIRIDSDGLSSSLFPPWASSRAIVLATKVEVSCRCAYQITALLVGYEAPLEIVAYNAAASTTLPVWDNCTVLSRNNIRLSHRCLS